MLTIRLTQGFQDWLDALRDRRAQIRIVARLRLAEAGNLGDWKSLGEGISEMRVDYGPGYRLYFTRRGRLLILMLAGGDKSSQARDVRRAKRLLDELELES
ncbi:MAG: type II toxin-antitoxin system RelE/ParE family toxin [Thermoanaerobaculia bacterium]|jgi:putative addiction module killer protein|nr:MAG: type II toxin-antitoxin system RelE/ParE family toxin [Thermoanaerobaculia bacterium]